MFGFAVILMTSFESFNKKDLNQIDKQKLWELHELQPEPDSMH